MNRYEVSIKIIDDRLLDQMILGLVYQGYNVYYNPDYIGEKCLCFTATDEDVTEIKEK